MPSALETLVKILKLERDTDYQNTAVIGGLESFAANWVPEAHAQAKRPEHHQLVDELAILLKEYGQEESLEERYQAIKYMLGRIMGRIPPPDDLPAAAPDEEAGEEEPDGPEQQERAGAAPAQDTRAPAPDEETGEEQVQPEPAPQAAAEPAETPDEPEAAGESGEPDEAPAVLPLTPVPPRDAAPQLSTEEAINVFAELQQPVTVLPRIGDKMAEKLERLGLETMWDLLFTFPRRYDDYSKLRALYELRPGEVVTVIASVRSVTRKQSRNGKPYLLVILDDDTGTLQVSFFGQLWLQRQFKPGSQVVLSGKVGLFRGTLAMTNPEWEMLERDNLHTGRIVPVYSLTKGVSARTIRRLVRQTLDTWQDRIPDYMPQSVRDRTGLVSLNTALQQVHFPESHEMLAHARTRLSFDELLLFQMAMLRRRREWQSEPGQPVSVSDDWIRDYLENLPFQLTGAQGRVLVDIRDDLARNVPMNRLLQGDVGSGKTAVAAMSLAMVVQAGKQAALMAPTSILAEQHARSVRDLLRLAPGGEDITVRLLTGHTGEAERQEIYAGLADGSIDVVIGTHALIQENVTFDNLALAIIDEQHRFGVEQRGVLRGKGFNPHVLVMTATPIPRTLALTLYADLDLSIIDEMPPGRTPVETRVIYPVERERSYGFIRSQLEKGRQAFMVYPLVETSDKLEDVEAATEAYDRLKDIIFYNYAVGLLHGRMPADEKEAVMGRFAAGEIDVLVSTSVVEVGIDVPNASVILIENAERFGLAQLHQFRGRVGRGEHQSYCLLVNTAANDDAIQRLQAMEDTTDGFKLAEIDWEMRGPGDLMGMRQSGISDFQLAELMNPHLVALAQQEARTLYAEDPALTMPEHHLLAQRVQALVNRRADIS